MKKISSMILVLISILCSSYVPEIYPATLSPEKQEAYLGSKPEYSRTLKAMHRLRSGKTAGVGIAVHRAANEFAPENTLAAMQCALDLEVDYIEMDVRLTKDGVSVILHDGNLNRTTNGKGAVKDLDFSDVLQLSAGTWFDPAYASEKVPTLEESCSLVAAHNSSHKHQTYFYVDCKEPDFNVLIATLKKYSLLEKSVFYVNREQQIGQIRSLAPEARILPGLGNKNDLERMISMLHPYALDVNWKDLSRELIDKAHAGGVLVFSDGFGENQNAGNYSQAIRNGIDVISTNKVSVICDALEQIAH